MARARGIKPGFFHDADVVDLPMEARLLFIGLWTVADRAGRLEDKPKQIKMDVFPADNVDVDELLDKIAATGMLKRYQVDGKRYLQVVSFTKHQNPHRDEKPSTIPEPPQHTGAINQTPPLHHASTMQAPCKQDADTVAIGLTPDSCILTPDCSTPTSNVEEVGNAVGQALPDPKPPSIKKTRRRSQLPGDFYPNETGLSKAADKGLSVAVELTRFLDFHIAKGSLMADWQAAWRTWIGNTKSPPPHWQKAPEPHWRTEQKNRTLQAVPNIAEKPLTPQNFTDVESKNVTAIALG